MEYRILGQLEVLRQGEPLDLGGPKQRAVLALLLIEANRVVPVDRLVEQLWNGRPPASGIGTLQAYVSNLRRVLEPERTAGATASVLVTHPPGYLLRVGPDELDAARFERLAEEARQAVEAGDHEAAAALLDQALRLWRGDALAEFAYEPFAAVEAARLEERRLTMLEDRMDAMLALGRHREVVADLEQVVNGHPLRERPRLQLMLALYRSDRQVEALRCYEAGRRLLADELGIDPSPALRALEQAVLDHDAALTWRPPPPARRRPAPAPKPTPEPVVGADPGAAAPAPTGVAGD
ncbi:MAG: AfsR/SARP family transcriptional regulator, partial [Actinomycetota bacterium]|nr:AfsR/SARP family transcriptional regulator [Actinomycetota bacterium]